MTSFNRWLLVLFILLPVASQGAIMKVGDMWVSTNTIVTNALRISHPSGTSYTDLRLTNSVIATNQIILSIGSNTVTAGQGFVFHSSSISGGINTIVATNGPVGGVAGINDLIWTNNTATPAIELAPALQTNTVRMGTGTLTNLSYNPLRKSLRMGQLGSGLGSDYWDITNLGIASVAFGSNALAGGIFSAVLSGTHNLIPTNQIRSVIVGGEANFYQPGVGQLNFIGVGKNINFGVGNSNCVVVGGLDHVVDAGIAATFIGGGTQNRTREQNSVVTGGQGNETFAAHASIGGGLNNRAGDDNTDLYATVPGGSENVAKARGSAIGGGENNLIEDTGVRSVIAGGWANTGDSVGSFIGSGFGNRNGNLADYSVIVGGWTNQITTSGASIYSGIMGGASNNIAAANMSFVMGSFATNSTPKSILLAAAGPHGSNQLHVTATATTNLGPVLVKGSLAVGVNNAGTVTNILVASATLNFPDTSVGSVADLPITCVGAEDGDVVSVGAPQASVTPIIGSYFGFASNGVVYVRFIPTAASQNPDSGTFKVLVTKF